MKNKLQKIILHKAPGQAVLIVLVISTLTMMLLMGVASRINLGQASVRRTGEFDRAVAATDNALNQVIKVVEGCSISFASAEYTQLLGCDGLNSFPDSVQVFGKESLSKMVKTSPTDPISLFLGGSVVAQKSTGVRVVCNNNSDKNKFIVTRVYQDAEGYKVDKGVTDCAAVDLTKDPNVYSKGNVKLFGTDSNGSPITVSDPFSSTNTDTARINTKLVRIRPLDTTIISASNEISVELIDTVGGASSPVASTGKYDFIVMGAGGLGSDVAIKFEIPRGDYKYVPSAFDFVYFGEDL